MAREKSTRARNMRLSFASASKLSALSPPATAALSLSFWLKRLMMQSTAL